MIRQETSSSEKRNEVAAKEACLKKLTDDAVYALTDYVTSSMSGTSEFSITSTF